VASPCFPGRAYGDSTPHSDRHTFIYRRRIQRQHDAADAHRFDNVAPEAFVSEAPQMKEIEFCRRFNSTSES
jgi:hypothetical protein